MFKGLTSFHKLAVSHALALSLVLPLLIYSIFQAWQLRFLQDDGFISFRYALNLSEGNGLVFNIGDKVEGYSNFLYTLLMVVPHLLGVDVESFSNLMNMSFWLLGLWAVYSLCRRQFDFSVAAALATVLLLASNASYAIYATGGLETAMVISLVLTSLLLFTRASEHTGGKAKRWRIAASLVATCAMLTRLDAFIPLSLIFFFQMLLMLDLAYEDAQRDDSQGVIKRFMVMAMHALLPIGLLLTVYLTWKFFYYGDILPNTFYIKVAGAESTTLTSNSERGMEYIKSFAQSYLYWPASIFLLWMLLHSADVLTKLISISNLRALRKALSKQRHVIAATSLMTVLIWSAYLVRVGGDFMEYRFALMLLPFLSLLLVYCLSALTSSNKTRVFVLLVLVMASYQNNMYLGERPRGVESRGSLQAHVYHPAHNWKGIGLALKRYFPASSDVKIAITAAGAIPYFSGLYTLDMLGLNDKWVAKHGMPQNAAPGHQRITSLQYMLDSNIDFIIAHPQLIRKNVKLTAKDFNFQQIKGRFWLRHRMSGQEARDALNSAQFLRMPITPGYDLLVIWLDSGNQALSSIIGKKLRQPRWRVYPLNLGRKAVSVTYQQLQMIKPVGTFWRAAGNIVIEDKQYLELSIVPGQVTEKLELSLDHNDAYTLSFYSRDKRGGDMVLETVVLKPKFRVGGGLSLHQVSLKASSVQAGIYKIKIEGVGGDGMYSIGHLRFL